MYLEISDPTPYCVGLYIRLSKEDENEGPSESVTNQQSLLEAFARQHRLSVFATYVDDGVSGGSFDRPGFNRLVADIEAKKVNMVITKDLSRLGRDYIMTGHYMERFFPEHQVRYISLLDGIDTGVDSTANDITPFRAIMNDMYAKDISKKIQSVKHDKQRKGLFIGGKPVYGYKMHPTQKNKIVIDEESATVVRRIFTMALAGESCRAIASRLNAEKIPTPATYANLPVMNPGPYTGLWSSERISDMLQNETYIGNMVQGRRKKISYKTKKCRKQPATDWIVVPGTHEPLVAAADFQAVRRLLESRRRTRSRTYEFPLKGLVYCHECGAPLAVINRKKPGGEDCLYFVCRTYQRFTKAGVCTCHCIKEETVREAVLAKVSEVCQPYLHAEQLLPMAQCAVAEAHRTHGPKQALGALQAKVGSITERLDKMYFDKLNGVLEDADFDRLYQKTKEERKTLEARIKHLEGTRDAPAKGVDFAEDLVQRFLEGANTNRELLVSIIERVELTEDKQIILRFRFRPTEAVSCGLALTLPQAGCIAHREKGAGEAEGGI